MSDQKRDEKLEEIACECLKINSLNLHVQPYEVTVLVVDIKQALQLAYTFGRDSKT